MAKAQYAGQDVECVRGANAGDPGFDPAMNKPMLLLNADGTTSVVPGNEVLLYAADDAVEGLTSEVEAEMEAEVEAAPAPKAKKK
jgi:hypothetical protein